MKVSTRVEYGLIALTDIVLYGENGTAVSAPDIAQRENISHKYLEQILLLLRQAGFIVAQKGIRGGYALAKPAEKISMREVLNALDNTILADMDDDKGNGGLRSVIKNCFWKEINQNLNQYTSEMNLSDFAGQCRNSFAGGWDNYVI
ncbi:MAG: Rrf2 family transcriptional regulator [Lachnospiraceae bacterium]|nr:Rrf2 family transcriptional regulator [Lachnospiraceae bacterium]